MQKKYAKSNNFAAISVALDDAQQSGITDKLLKFLKGQNAGFTHLLLDEKPEFWQEKLKFEGPPCVYVFNQQGQVEKQFKDEFTYKDVAKVVEKLLDKKK
jgi:hypothetical protein